MSKAFSKRITLPFLIRFTLPSIIVMVFTALYTIVDGFFVSNFVNTDALSAVNIVYPVINIVYAIGLMFGTGALPRRRAARKASPPSSPVKWARASGRKPAGSFPSSL